MSQRKKRISLTSQPKQTASISAVETIMLAVLLAAVFGINFGRQLSGDIWWHLKAGEWMLENRAFPFADPFSYTASHSWILQEWGFQVIAWVISGVSLELLVWICFAAFITALLITYGTAKSRGGFGAAFIVTLLAAGVCADMVDARPHVFGLLAFAVLIRWIDRSVRDDRGLPIWLPLLFLAWANFHSSFTAGLIVLGAECVGSFYSSLKTDGPGRFGRPLRDSAVTLACALVALINPNGLHLYEFPLRTVSHGGMTSIIGEWMSPNFRSLSGAFLGLSLLALGWGLATRDKPIRTADALRICVFVAAALLARRLGPFFILACAPILAGLISSQIQRLMNFKKMTAAVCILIAILAIGGVSHRIKDMQGRSAFEYVTSSDVFPTEACDYILREELPGPIFNELNYGSYLIWRLWPEYKVFVDNRNDIFYDGAFDAYMAATMSGGNSIWRRVFEKYEINTVILDQNSALGDILIEAPDWRIIYRDAKAVIFMRASVLP